MKLGKPTKKPKTKQEKDLEGASQFIRQAENRGEGKPSFPWENADPKQTKAFNLRLPLDLYAKLKYVADNTPRTSMNNLCIDAIEPDIEKKLKDILQKGEG